MTTTPSPMRRHHRGAPGGELLGGQDVGAAEHRLRRHDCGQHAQDGDPEAASGHGAEYKLPRALRRQPRCATAIVWCDHDAGEPLGGAASRRLGRLGATGTVVRSRQSPRPRVRDCGGLRSRLGVARVPAAPAVDARPRHRGGALPGAGPAVADPAGARRRGHSRRGRASSLGARRRLDCAVGNGHTGRPAPRNREGGSRCPVSGVRSPVSGARVTGRPVYRTPGTGYRLHGVTPSPAAQGN